MDEDKKYNYHNFLLMILTAVWFMFCLTYLNTFESSHVYWSETRLYMSLLMGSVMTVIMLAFMKSMYKDLTLNIAILSTSGLVFVSTLLLVRSQATVGDTSYMKAMIPHHSIAILTSDRANIEDWRVKKLAKEIKKTQIREIKEMVWLIDDIRSNGLARTDDGAVDRAVPNFDSSDE